MTPEAEAFHSLILEYSTLNADSQSKNQQFLKITQQSLKMVALPNFAIICFDLLQTYTYTKDQLTLITNFLKNKFMKQFQCMDVGDSLSHLITRFQSTIRTLINPPTPAIINICLCLCYIYIHKASSLTDVLVYLSKCLPQPINPKYFFKTLQLIPQQCQRFSLVIDDLTREQSIQIVSAQADNVVQQLNTLAPKHWEQTPLTKQFILECFGSWIAVQGIHPLTINALPQHFIFQAALKCIASQDQDAQRACTCIRNTLSHLQFASHGSFLAYLAQQLFNIIPHIDSMLKDYEYIPAEECVKMLCNFAEKAVNVFLNNFDANILLYLQKLIKYAAVDELQCFNSMADFWEIFLDEVIANKHLLRQQFLTLFQNLYDVMCYNIQYPWKMLEKLNSVSEDKLADRHNQVEVILERREQTKYIFDKISKIIGKNQFVKMTIRYMVAAPKENPNLFWPKIQSYIHSLRKPLNQFPAVTEELLQVVHSFQELNPPHTMLRKSYLKLVDALMTIKEKNEPFIKNLFFLLSKHLDNALLQDTVDGAFCKGCDENALILSKDLMQLIPIIQQHPNRKQLIQGVTLVMNANAVLVAQYLPNLLRYQCAQMQSSTHPRKAYNSLFVILDTLRFQGDTTPYQHILLNFTREFWPTIKTILAQPKEINVDEDVGVERGVKLVKILMRCLRHNFAQFFKELFEIALLAYSKYPLCSYLYLLEISITVFYTSPQYMEGLKTLYKQFCQITYTHLNSIQSFQKYFLLVGDFLGLNTRFLLYNATLILESSELQHILSICLQICVGSKTPSVAKAAYYFFQVIFMGYWAEHFIEEHNDKSTPSFKRTEHAMYGQLKVYLLEKMPFILSKMIEHLANCPLDTTAEYILDALSSQIKAFPLENQAIWLAVLQNTPPRLFVRKEKQLMYEWLPMVGGSKEQGQLAITNIHALLYKLNKRAQNEKQ